MFVNSTGKQNYYFTTYSVFENVTALWTNALQNEIYLNYPRIQKYLQDNYNDLTKEQKETADERYWVRLYTLNYEVIT